jgi:hypothetical protein
VSPPIVRLSPNIILVTKSDFLWNVAPCGMVNRYQLFGGQAAGIILRWRWEQYVTPKYFNNLQSYMTSQSTKKIILCNQSQNVLNIKALMLVVMVNARVI